MELQDPFLQLSSSKNEGGRVRLCPNSVAFTLPTTVAAVKRTLATTVALGSFSTAFKACIHGAYKLSADTLLCSRTK